MKIWLMLAVAVVACLWGTEALAQTHHVPLAVEGKDMILDVIRDVLKIIVDFIGDVLDEFVRAIRDLMSGSGKD